MDDGDILKPRGKETRTTDVYSGPDLRLESDNILLSTGTQNVEILSNDNVLRFIAWRKTEIPSAYMREKLEEYVGCGDDSKIDTDAIITLSSLVKTYVGKVVGEVVAKNKSKSPMTVSDLLEARDEIDGNRSPVRSL